jgi:hypothetical protein
VGKKIATTAINNRSFETVQFARDVVDENWPVKRGIFSKHADQISFPPGASLASY